MKEISKIDALASKNKMNNQTAAALAAIANAVDWEKTGLDQQAIIEAANQGRLGGPLTAWLVAREWNKVGAYLRLLSKLRIGVTDGKDTCATARKVFRAYFSPDFENRGIVFSGVAPEIEIVSNEIVQNGKFSDFFGNTATELEKRRLLGSQFLKICRTPDKLRDGNRANFFVLTRGDEKVAEDLSNVFVARVCVYGNGELDAVLSMFRHDSVWRGDDGRRVFYPQQ